MRTPDILTTLVDHGVIDEVLRPLMGGKEAQVYLVSSAGEQRVAKIYKDAQNRSFQNRAEYTEGRKVRNSRDQRAMHNRSRHGKAQNESAWKSAEVSMIYRLREAGVRVPTPYHFIDGVLIMELVTDAEGWPAPRLGDLTFEPEEATRIFQQVIGQVVRMLCAGVVHGDLSDFNVLMGADGPVIIDFPQAVDASTNQNARKLLLRDVDNLHRFHAKFAPLVQPLPYAQEMWDLYQRMALTPETRLSGKFRVSKKAVDTDDVLSLIADAEHDERRRREGLARAMRQGRREEGPGQAGLPHASRGGRAPAPGGRQVPSGQRRPERPAMQAGSSRQRSPERPQAAERRGAHGEQSSPDKARARHEARVQQLPKGARADHHRAAHSEGDRATGQRAFAAEKPREAREKSQPHGRKQQGDRAFVTPQQTSRDARPAHRRDEPGREGGRDFRSARERTRDARANARPDARKTQGASADTHGEEKLASDSARSDEHRRTRH